MRGARNTARPNEDIAVSFSYFPSFTLVVAYSPLLVIWIGAILRAFVLSHTYCIYREKLNEMKYDEQNLERQS